MCPKDIQSVVELGKAHAFPKQLCIMNVFQKLRQCAWLKLLVCTEDGKRCFECKLSLNRSLHLIKNLNCHDGFDFVKEIRVC